MSNNNEENKQSSSAVNKAIITLLLAAVTSSGAALLGIWKQSALTEQRINAIDDKHLVARISLDDKYIEKSGRVVNRVDALAISLANHFKDDNAHQLLIQKQHLNFEYFMKKLRNAHIDIETNKHKIELMQEGCCKIIGTDLSR